MDITLYEITKFNFFLVNGVKHDSNDKNFKVLCKLCHKKEPKHSHMK